MSIAAVVRHREFSRPWLYPAQQLAIFDGVDVNGAPARWGFIEASTKAGKTSACIAWLVEQAAQGSENQNYWWVAPVYTQAKIAYRRMKTGLPKHLYTANESELFIKLRNGALIWFKSAEKSDNLYGEDVYAAVVDEASRVREESWHAVRSTLTATQGPMRAIGNVKGRKNWFYNLSRRAEAGAPNMSHARLDAYDAVKGGVLAASEIEDAKTLLPEHVFKELYLAQAGEDDSSPFGMGHIEACIGPLSEAAPVAIGIDLAKSTDWTVVIGLDQQGRCCGLERWQKVPWRETVARIVDLVGHTPALADSTGLGDPVVERIQERCSQVEGFTFSSPSKQKLMEGLSVAIQSRLIRFPAGAIRSELETFEYVYTRTGVRYSAPEGYHDDCVMALGLAVDLWRQTAHLHGALPPPIGIEKPDTLLTPHEAPPPGLDAFSSLAPEAFA